ncbi:MAG: ATP-grasp domain-containing protein [Burkholderiales bacterium]
MNEPRRLTVAVTGLNARADNPGPGLAVVRCLRESAELGGFDLRIVGLSYDALDPGLYHPGCDAAYLLGYPFEGSAALAERLRHIHAKERLDAIIPCLDAELPNFTQLQTELQSWGIRSFLPSTRQLQMRDKSRLVELAKLAGIAAPETKLIHDASFFHTCERLGWSYPIVVKGLYYDAQVCGDATTAIAAFNRIGSTWGMPLIVQRVIKGEEYNLAGIGDGFGKLLGPVMMKKRALTDKGKAWAGVTVHDERLLATAESIVRHLGWRGALEVEVMRDDTGTYHLIEINPRFPAWIYLSAGVGRNLPAALLRLIVGAALPTFPPVPTGTLFIRYAEEVIVSMAQFEAMMLTNTRASEELIPKEIAA